jgi:hypothetical protein
VGARVANCVLRGRYLRVSVARSVLADQYRSVVAGQKAPVVTTGHSLPTMPGGGVKIL